MINNPLVSVVIPTYNQHEIFLRESIESAINQTYSNIEIVISDNHSTNGASEIIASYAQKDSRIRIVKPPRFVPLIENFIFAYNEVKGEYICPLSSDDILYPEIVTEQLQPFLTYSNLSFSYSKPLFFDTDVNKAKWTPGKLDTGFYDSNNFVNLFLNYRDCSWGGLLFKTSDYHKIGGFNKEYVFVGDFDLLIKLILLGDGVYCINKPLSAVRLWQRKELTDRVPYQLAENAKIFNDLKHIGVANNNASLISMVEKAKRNNFAPEVFQIPYYIQVKKRPPEGINKLVTIIKENYPKGFFSFIIANRQNIIGLTISIGFLSFSKFKNFFTKKA